MGAMPRAAGQWDPWLLFCTPAHRSIILSLEGGIWGHTWCSADTLSAVLWHDSWWRSGDHEVLRIELETPT